MIRPRYLYKELLCMVCALFVCLSSFEVKCQQTQVSVIEFGAIPNDGVNDRLAIAKALLYCKQNSIHKLIFPEGRYILEHPEAINLMQNVMSMMMGENPEKVIFTPYYKYIKGIDLSGQQNLELAGYGAKLLCKGWMEPVSIENANDITITGFTIDYARQPHSEGQVISVSKDYFDVKFPQEDPVYSNLVMPRIMFYDNKTNRMAGFPIYFPKKNELIDTQVLRIWDKIPESFIGDMALVNHSFHFRPAILIHESNDIRIENVTIHSQPGMGIVGHRSHNITMHGLRVVPRAGRRQSTNTDATHFTSCTGKIYFKNCMFEGQGDDATNVHNYYYSLTDKIEDKYVTQVKAPTGTHAQVLDYPDVGDTLELVNKSSLRLIKRVVVKEVETYPEKWETRLKLNQTIEENLDSCLLINVTRLPRLHMEGCTIRSHLARGVLIKTRNVLIENCTIVESTGTGIHIGAEGSWHEGPGSSNVIVRNNRILRCGSGDGAQNEASGIAVNVVSSNPAKSGVHHNLLFENNIIEGENAKYGIYVTGADSVIIQNNEISGCSIPVKK